MVLRSFVNLTERTGASFARRRASNVSSSSGNKCYSHPFFKPSYAKPQDLLIVDDVAREESGRKTRYCRYCNILTPAAMVTRNYVIFGQSRNTDDETRGQTPILLKKAGGKTNKNGHMSVHVGAVANGRCQLRLRRSNSTTVRTFALERPSGRRQYSTVHELERQLRDLQVGEMGEAAETAEKSEQAKKVDPASPLSVHERLIDDLLSSNRPSEVLAVYFNLRGKGLVPTTALYNKVLRSIPQRTDTGESAEDKLTHLLNVYSDMLSNNLKPSDETYELVVGPLLKGAQNSYSMGEFRNSKDFFRIALELFLISHNSNAAICFDQAVYHDLVRGLNRFKCVQILAADKLYELLKSRVDLTENLSLFLQLLKYAGFSKNTGLVNALYHDINDSIDAKVLEAQQYDIYAVMLESLLLCGQSAEATAFLDQVVGHCDKSEQRALSKLLSSFIAGQAALDPAKAYNSYLRFNAVDWLPEVSVASLAFVMRKFLDANDFGSALQVWNMIVPRKDFDEAIDQLVQHDDYEYLSSMVDTLVGAALDRMDRKNLIRFTREIIIKDSLVLSNESLLNLVSYLNSNEKQTELATALVINQGYKKSRDGTSLNNYLSLLVDFLTPSQYQSLFGSGLFKTAVEQYRVVNDNIYGLIKIFDYVSSLSQMTDQIKLKMKYYGKVLSFEFEDASNHYVQLPAELARFKQYVSQLAE
ncbi:hypothetical protein KL935_001583 [Ogataea polymorpha]|nr:hypothetical protein KL937_000998 [Ogataea polymorpha]KAG7902675.1 hypothetical protein KL935_001583 [Ogataea polymorpha]KAG7912830.1 hypothetical protein KL907_001032 [Ogataea polymorpha]KAG7919445.1 hypothetical protein KL927_001574 [Ogataea polymorpha]KAG7940057.1 hypothetical protein KL904_000995 [Ogataea polymorpha]